MYLLGKVEEPVSIPFHGTIGNQGAYGSNVYLALYPPSRQMCRVLHGGGGGDHVYSIPVPWTLCLLNLPPARDAAEEEARVDRRYGRHYGNSVHILTVNFAKSNPLDNNLIYRSWLHNIFYHGNNTWGDRNTNITSPHVITGMCGTYIELPADTDIRTHRGMERALAAGCAGLWQSRLRGGGELQYVGHPIYAPYNLTVGRPNSKPFFDDWENMTLEELSEKDWGTGETLESFAASVGVKLDVQEFKIPTLV